MQSETHRWIDYTGPWGSKQAPGSHKPRVQEGVGVYERVNCDPETSRTSRAATEWDKNDKLSSRQRKQNKVIHGLSSSPPPHWIVIVWEKICSTVKLVNKHNQEIL